MQNEKIDFLSINNDVNGNPRYVCHYVNFLSSTKDSGIKSGERYDLALSRARAFGGRKFHNKQYAGGIVFQSYNIDRLGAEIQAMVAAL